jgi:hypothetical protein
MKKADLWVPGAERIHRSGTSIDRAIGTLQQRQPDKSFDQNCGNGGWADRTIDLLERAPVAAEIQDLEDERVG